MISTKKLLIFGAGKSATSLIRYLLSHAASDNLEIIVADANYKLAEEKISGHPSGKALALDISDNSARKDVIAQSDIVISMMPPALHILVAKDCLEAGKNLLTASYADDAIRGLDAEVRSKGLLFLCEMGLDPGIDHMSAMQIIEHISSKGGKITSFFSHCGGLIAPESDDNPWHYKITWNPRNVVLAGKGGAKYLSDGIMKETGYLDLFDASRQVATGNVETPFLSYYPNRDSLPYIALYGLDYCRDFMRTTLRYPDFMRGWKTMIEYGFTDETIRYETQGLSLAAFYQKHFQSRNLTIEQVVENNSTDFSSQLEFLGLYDHDTLINMGEVSIIDIMQFILQKKLVLHEEDKDLVVMIHEFIYELDNKKHALHSSLYLKGDDQLQTAMAKTVGLPLGIAARMILQNKIRKTGVCIPLDKEIYEPVLSELKALGIAFVESENEIS